MHGGGYFSKCKAFERTFNNSFPACLPVCLFVVVVLRWRLGHAHQCHSLGQDQSTVAQQTEMTVTKCSLTSCMWVHFLMGSHTTPVQQHSQPTPSLLGQGYMHACLGVSCHLHFWQNDRGYLHATEVTQGWNGHWISQHTKSNLEKKILPPLLPGFELTTFQSRVWRFIKLYRLVHRQHELAYGHLSCIFLNTLLILNLMF